MAFHKNGELFFIDNEGGGNPTEELNRLVVNSFYGHNKKKYPADSGKVMPPVFDLQSEVAPSAIEFNPATNDFGGTAGNLFVAYYGPGERWTRGAVARVLMEPQADGSFQYKEYTLADMPKLSDLAFGKDGNLYLAHHGQADYWYNSIYPRQGGFYKLIYDPTSIVANNYVRPKKEKTFSRNSVEMGKQLFAEYGCLGCHQVDGKTELLGPNLKDVSKNYSRAEILEAIQNPSAQIKPSMMGVRLTKNNGQVFLGRIIASDEQEISMMLVGNQVITIARQDIASTEDEKKSLMFAGLLRGQPEEKVNALLDFLMSLEE
jgi:putative heme-binding domain-containing protein